MSNCRSRALIFRFGRRLVLLDSSSATRGLFRVSGLLLSIVVDVVLIAAEHAKTVVLAALSFLVRESAVLEFAFKPRRE